MFRKTFYFLLIERKTYWNHKQESRLKEKGSEY